VLFDTCSDAERRRFAGWRAARSRIRIEERVIDLATVEGWLKVIGWSCQPCGPEAIRIVCPEAQNIPFFARLTEHWLMLAIVPVISRAGCSL
jgi:hypothetical protein